MPGYERNLERNLLVSPMPATKTELIRRLRELVATDDEQHLSAFFRGTPEIISSQMLVEVFQALPNNPQSEINRKLALLRDSRRRHEVNTRTGRAPTPMLSFEVQHLLAHPEKLKVPDSDQVAPFSALITASMKCIALYELPILLNWNKILTEVPLDRFDAYHILQRAIVFAMTMLDRSSVIAALANGQQAREAYQFLAEHGIDLGVRPEQPLAATSGTGLTAPGGSTNNSPTNDPEQSSSIWCCCRWLTILSSSQQQSAARTVVPGAEQETGTEMRAGAGASATPPVTNPFRRAEL